MVRRLVELAPVIPGAVKVLSHVPFSWRKGPDYSRFQQEAEAFERYSPEERKQWIFKRVRELVAHAESKVPFYQKIYAEAGFSSAEVGEFDDLKKIPIITKTDLSAWMLDQRCTQGMTAAESNTGGTSGQPLTFRIENSLIDKEWAYIYRLWERRGWRPGFLKLRFGGANLGDRPFQYVPTEGEFLVNTYLGQDVTCRAITGLLRQYTIHYLHGYPSAVASFARHAGEHFHKEIVEPLRRNLRGILLGSEFPVPCYRDLIEETFGSKTISWYGHSEKAVLAGEKDEQFVYNPFQSYGWTEAIPQDGSGSCRLVGTNLDGFACPFIRYDTGDLVTPVEYGNGLLESFRVAEGRIGDIVHDENGSEISLTALIFGRHHEVFAKVSHLQVAQRVQGEVLLLATGMPATPERENEFWQGFDTTGVALRFTVRFLGEPIRTTAGKVALKVPFPID